MQLGEVLSNRISQAFSKKVLEGIEFLCSGGPEHGMEQNKLEAAGVWWCAIPAGLVAAAWKDLTTLNHSKAAFAVVTVMCLLAYYIYTSCMNGMACASIAGEQGERHAVKCARHEPSSQHGVC